MRLDVSDLLTDTDFVDTFTVTRNVQTVGDDGLAVSTSQVYSASGVVQPASSRIIRNAEGQIITGEIVVYTRFRLTEGGGDRDADVVTHNGEDYTVISTDDWSRWGKGYIRAVCKTLRLWP